MNHPRKRRTALDLTFLVEGQSPKRTTKSIPRLFTAESQVVIRDESVALGVSAIVSANDSGGVDKTSGNQLHAAPRAEETRYSTATKQHSRPREKEERVVRGTQGTRYGSCSKNIPLRGKKAVIKLKRSQKQHATSNPHAHEQQRRASLTHRRSLP